MHLSKLFTVAGTSLLARAGRLPENNLGQDLCKATPHWYDSSPPVEPAIRSVYDQMGKDMYQTAPRMFDCPPTHLGITLPHVECAQQKREWLPFIDEKVWPYFEQGFNKARNKCSVEPPITPTKLVEDKRPKIAEISLPTVTTAAKQLPKKTNPKDSTITPKPFYIDMDALLKQIQQHP